MSEIAYLFDGTFDGLLCCLFASYTRRELPVDVVEGSSAQLVFGRSFLTIETIAENARRVERGLITKAGSSALQLAWTAFLSCRSDKGHIVFRYFRACFTLERGIYNHLTHPDVMPVHELVRLVNGEAHHLQMFARFAEMENGVYYCRITPKSDVVTLLMPHFVDRFSIQPFLIHDPVHQTAGVYDMNDWYMVETDGLNLPDISEDEAQCRQMWKRFYHSVAIQERRNTKLRRSFMPKKFWPNILEVQGEK